VPRPTTVEACLHGGWRHFGFKSQGQCIAFVVSHKHKHEHEGHEHEGHCRHEDRPGCRGDRDRDNDEDASSHHHRGFFDAELASFTHPGSSGSGAPVGLALVGVGLLTAGLLPVRQRWRNRRR
jgi:hypothetical protein